MADALATVAHTQGEAVGNIFRTGGCNGGCGVRSDAISGTRPVADTELPYHRAAPNGPLTCRPTSTSCLHEPQRTLTQPQRTLPRTSFLLPCLHRTPLALAVATYYRRASALCAAWQARVGDRGGRVRARLEGTWRFGCCCRVSARPCGGERWSALSR
ncbi:hypothetical protein EJ06DRAFT_30777 [Trichodelitschia bisporula]|uniref:Uncharacterized protein n=1 Tax=Trichodelitschia bisporula TaxID=703511 RepID=A0A6G1IC61_9PEZI|nr:hypothetical protein EJ06DRAFT_30777 [Trichodelitschia bisporula]